MNDKHIAVVGSGISGLSAAWLLQRNGANVTLYESESTCGGHTLTDDTSGFPVDLGFQVYNLTTYPHLVGFFEELDIDTEPSEMSFALSVDGGKLEWASHNLDTIFAQRSNITSPAFLSMIKDVLRFGREAPRILDPSNIASYTDMTLGEYLAQNKYSQFFIDNYVLPMCAAVWSVPSTLVLTFPVVMLIRFWVNHHLLDVVQRPVWRVVKGRSREYVNKVVSQLKDVRTSTPVTSVTASEDGTSVTVETASGETEEYDSIVMATHSDITLKLLKNADKDMIELLKDMPYNENDVWLHADPALMPRDRKTWASWNCIQASGSDARSRPVCVTYWVNRLQSLPKDAPDLFVTLNPPQPPASDKVIRQLKLAHPVFGPSTPAAQAKLPTVQGRKNIYLAGAWCGYGFHEDGIKSAVTAVEAMGMTSTPWIPRAVSPKIGLIDSAAIALFQRFLTASVHTGRLRFILPNGTEIIAGTPAPAPGKSEDSWRGRPPLDAVVRLYDVGCFRKIITRHDTGLGESYMDGDFDVIPLNGSGDLGSLLAVATANARNIEEKRGLLGLFNKLGDRALHLAHLARSNTVFGSRKNIEEHYDAGNEMYKVFLDESMTYSCGLFTGPDCSLYQSQMNKIDALIEKAGITGEHNVLEIGCGWGSFAIRAVQKTGCRVTGLTLSKEQLREANARVKAAGLSDKISLLFCDYRDCPGLGTYDRLVSCEMIEAVGHEHMKAYFLTLGAALKPGGVAALQVIAEPDERYEEYCNSSDFIREHIFPGGHLPCMGAMVEAARGTGLTVHGCTDYGPDYAVTLRAWRKEWEDKKADVLALGYSERFWRKYRFYFAYCEAAFDARYIHLFQVTWKKDTEPTITEAEIQAAIDQSKGLTTSATASPLEVVANPIRHDPLNQVLLALYFFLVGIAVATSNTLWLMPLATLVSALAFAATGTLSRIALPFYRTLAPERSALWCLETVHIVYSVMAAVVALFCILSNPGCLILTAPQSATLISQALVAASAGFFGFVLWAEVNAHLYTKSYTAIVHYSFMLILFSAANFKSVNTPFLASSLIGEASSAVHMARRMAETASYKNVAGSAALVEKLTSVDWACFVGVRLVPHALMGLATVFGRQAFSSTGYYLLAIFGMAWLNAFNIKRAMSMLVTKPGTSVVDKAHTD